MLPDFQLIFGSATALWLALKGFDVFMERTSPQKVLREDLPWIIIAWALLFINANGLISQIFNLTIEIMTGISIKIFEVSGLSLEDSGLTGLIKALELGIWEVVITAQKMIEQFSFPNNMVAPIVLPILLVVPYFLVLIVYFSQIIVNIFRIVILATFFPFIFMGVGFGFWRDMGKTAIKTIFASIMVMSASTIVVSFMLFAVLRLELGVIDVSFTNEKIIFAVIIGWAMTALLAEGTAIANSIAGSVLTNTAAGIMTSGLAGSAAMAFSSKVMKFANSQMQDNDHIKGTKMASSAGIKFAKLVASRGQRIKNLFNKEQ